ANAAVAYCVCFVIQAEDGIRDRNVTGVQTCALPISCGGSSSKSPNTTPNEPGDPSITQPEPQPEPKFGQGTIEVLSNHAELISGDRKSTRLNSSHVSISYAVFCLKTKTTS